MGSRLLITGGAGFIGRHVGRALAARDVEVVALDTLNEQVHRSREASVAQFPGQVVEGDVRDAAAVAAAMAGASAVVHLAAETGVGQSMYEQERYTSVNVDGTRIVLEEAARLGIPTVVASSRAVYGAGAFECPSHGRGFRSPCCEHAAPSSSRESDAIAPVSVYGETKADGEKVAEALIAQGSEIISVRPQNVIGAGQALHNPYTGVLAAFASRIGEGAAIQVYGDGTQTRDFISVTDVAADIVWLLDHTERWSGVPAVNVGSGERLTLTELAEASFAAAGREPDLAYVDVTRPGDIDHACADLEVADRLGLPRATVSAREAVAEFMAFALSSDPVDSRIWDVALDEVKAVADE